MCEKLKTTRRIGWFCRGWKNAGGMSFVIQSVPLGQAPAPEDRTPLRRREDQPPSGEVPVLDALENPHPSTPRLSHDEPETDYQRPPALRTSPRHQLNRSPPAFWGHREPMTPDLWRRTEQKSFCRYYFSTVSIWTVEKVSYSSSEALRSREVSQILASRQARRIKFGNYSTLSNYDIGFRFTYLRTTNLTEFMV